MAYTLRKIVASELPNLNCPKHADPRVHIAWRRRLRPRRLQGRASFSAGVRPQTTGRDGALSSRSRYPSPLSQNWGLKSEAIFNQLLWDIGVSQAQIHEIYTLDLDSFESIKYCSWRLCSFRPVHGLIFLFKWKKEPNEEEVEISCPEGVWFANQVIDNSCASLAILNIILNIPDLDIGEHLAQFKEFTRDFSPPVWTPFCERELKQL